MTLLRRHFTVAEYHSSNLLCCYHFFIFSLLFLKMLIVFMFEFIKKILFEILLVKIVNRPIHVNYIVSVSTPFRVRILHFRIIISTQKTSIWFFHTIFHTSIKRLNIHTNMIDSRMEKITEAVFRPAENQNRKTQGRHWYNAICPLFPLDVCGKSNKNTITRNATYYEFVCIRLLHYIELSTMYTTKNVILNYINVCFMRIEEKKNEKW